MVVRVFCAMATMWNAMMFSWLLGHWVAVRWLLWHWVAARWLLGHWVAAMVFGVAARWVLRRIKLGAKEYCMVGRVCYVFAVVTEASLRRQNYSLLFAL